MNQDPLTIRPARPEDLDEILAIYAKARDFMRANGNPDQWGNSWPPLKRVTRDINEQISYVCMSDNKIAAVFCLQPGSPALSPPLQSGSWMEDTGEFALLLRIASAQIIPGAGSFCLGWASGKYRYLRADTRPENLPMIRCFEKNGFQARGVIAHSVRIAYEKDCSPDLARN